MNDKDIGKKALLTYYSYMKLLYPKSFKYSENEFFTILHKLKGAKNIEDGLGLGIRSAEISDAKAAAAMKKLAEQGGGKIPSSYMDFFNSLISESAKISYVDAAFYVAKESVKDIASGAQAIGDSVIFTGKIINFLLPVVALVFIYMFLKKRSNLDFIKGLVT